MGNVAELITGRDGAFTMIVERVVNVQRYYARSMFL
jgi:hypothetical protein